jgi:hypothetical protein
MALIPQVFLYPGLFLGNFSYKSLCGRASDLEGKHKKKIPLDKCFLLFFLLIVTFDLQKNINVHFFLG